MNRSEESERRTREGHAVDGPEVGLPADVARLVDAIGAELDEDARWDHRIVRVSQELALRRYQARNKGR